MSKQRNNKTAFFDTENEALNIDYEIDLYNGYSIEYDFNNTDLTANFSLALDLDLIK